MYELSKSPQSFPWNQFLDLTNEQLMQVESFVKYVEGLAADRIAFIYIRNPDGEHDMKVAFPLSNDMSAEIMRGQEKSVSAPYRILDSVWRALTFTVMPSWERVHLDGILCR